MSSIQALLNRTWRRSLTRTKSGTFTKTPSRLGKVIEQLEDRLTPSTMYAANPGSYTITNDIGAPGLSAGDTVTWNGAVPVAGLTFGTNAYSTIQSAVAGAASLDTVQVAAGTYTENVTINKQLTLLGAKAGVDARGRFVGVPNPATESVINPGSGRFIQLIGGSANTIINGFAFTGGTGRGIESTSGPIDGLQILNNDFRGMGDSAVFLNDNGLNITVDKNSFDGASQAGGGDLFHLDTDTFNGFYFTNNWLKNRTGGTGFFVDGNHNVGPSVLRTPLISGNLIDNNQTGMNLGTRAFGSFTVPNAGTISGNTFSNSGFDGLQGGIQNTLITQNTFTGNHRWGLALTSFGNLGADRGAQNSVITENFFSGNTGMVTSGDIVYSNTQAAGTVSTNKAFNNSFDAIGSTKTISYSGTESINANNNWFGSSVLATVLGSLGGTSAANIDTSPYLTTGTDTSGTTGFQGNFADLTVHTSGKQIGATTRIQEGVNTVTTAGTVRVTAGTYNELVAVTKTVTLLGAQAGVDARTRGAVPESIVSNGDGDFQILANNVVIDGFKLTGVVNDPSMIFTSLGAAIWTNPGFSGTNGGHQILNNIIDGNIGGIELDNDGTYQTKVQYNLIQNNTAPGAGSGNGLQVNFGLSKALIDNNKFVNNPNGSVSAFVGGPSITITSNEADSQIYVASATSLQISGNKITNSTGGGVVLGGGNSGVLITNNEVNGVATGFSAFRLRDDGPGANSNIIATNNIFVGGANGYGIRPGAGSYSGTLTVSESQISGGLAAVQNDDAALNINASTNYWGTTNATTVGATILGAGASLVDFTPLINLGDTAPGTVGFQSTLSKLTVHTQGAQTASGRVQEGVNVVNNGGTVNVTAGAYTDGVVTVSKTNITVDVPTGATGFSFLLGGTITTFSVTGTGAVDVTGNAANNVIAGNGGNNTILGSTGVDTVVFTGNYADYTFFFTGTGPTQTLTFVDNRVGSPDGTDVLNGVELLQFADGTRRVDPSTLVLSNNVIAENNPIGALVGVFSSDGYQPSPGLVNYTLVAGAGDTGNSKFSISGNQLLAAAKFNYEVTPSFSIRVRAEDAGGLFIESVYTINVLDIEEIPPVLALARGTTVDWINGAGVATSTVTIPAAFGTFNVAAIPDRTGDNFPDLIVGSGAGVASLLGLVNGKTGAIVWSTAPYAGFTGGVSVAVGDVSGDGKLDFITGPGNGGGPNVKVFDGISKALIRNFNAYATSFTGGVQVAAGDVNGDGRADIVTAPGRGGGPDVRIFNGMSNPVLGTAPTLLNNFNAFPATNTLGLSVSVADMNGDGYADIMVGSLGGPQVRVFSGVNYSMLLDFSTVAGGLGTQVAFRNFVEDGPVRLVTLTTTNNSLMLTSYDTSLSKQFSTTYSSAYNLNPPRRIG